MSPSAWPTFRVPPAVAFVDVDGTLLAQTTTFLFARILYRRGLIRRSFLVRALHHGLQHRFGRLDYGRLIEMGLNYIARIPVVVYSADAQPATVPAGVSAWIWKGAEISELLQALSAHRLR